VVALVAALALPGSVAADDADEAAAVLRTTVEEALEILDDEALSAEQKRAQVEALVEDHFDFAVIARLVVARSWRRFSETERQEFIVEFKKHLSKTYGRRLEAYDNERVEFGEARVESNGDVTCNTRILGGAAGSGVDIDYRMRAKQGEPYVIDVIIEGVSLIQNFREQIKGLLQGSTPQQLIEKLREKNAAKVAA
jgi:phospholipid transport system substrate-binding protein